MHRSFLWAAVLLGTAAAGGAQSKYVDPRYGFELRVPRDFREVPINMAEKWVVAKFLYKRPLEPKDAEVWVESTPEIRVIVFPKVDVEDVVAARKQKQEIEVKGKDGKVRKVTLLGYLQNPFRNYHEYLRENYKKGGWFVAKEERCKVGGLPAVRKVIEVDDKMRFGTKANLFAWEIDYGDAIYVVQFEVIRDYAAKFRPQIESAVRGFRKIARTEPLRAATTGSALSAEERSELAAGERELTPDERRKARERDLRRAVERAKRAMTGGWKTYEHGPFVVFYSTPARFARRVSKQAVLVWNWMHQNFGYIGEDHAVGSILRICKSSSEAASYTDTSTRSDVSLTAREIVVWDDKDWGWNDSGSSRLNGRIAMQYLADKNPRLWWALPPWLDHGLVLYIGSLKMKGNRLLAKPDEWDMEAIRDRLRKNAFKPAREIVKATYEDYDAGTSDSSDRVQSIAIVHFLMEKGRRIGKYRNLIRDYLRFLDERLREFEKEWRKKFAKAAKTEEEAKEREKWLSEWTKRRNRIYDECFERVFGGWTDRDWAEFDRQWRRAYKG